MLLRLPGASGRARYERTGVRPTFTNLRDREGVKPVTYGFFGHRPLPRYKFKYKKGAFHVSGHRIGQIDKMYTA